MSAFPLPLPARPNVAPRTLGRVGATARAEVSQLPARWLGGLPVPPRLGLHVPGVEGVVRVALDPRVGAREIDREIGEEETGGVVFDAEEWEALVRGVEADRIWPADWAAFCARKAAEPAWRLDLEQAMAGAQVDPGETWSLERVLSRLGVGLLALG